MKKFLTVASILVASTAAFAEDSSGLPWPPAPEPNPPAGLESDGIKLSAGLRVGYLRARDAERGTWLVGVQGRLQIIEYLAVEASIEFHQDEYMDGDVVVTTYPVQLSAMLFPLPQVEIQPYLLAGVGWYYSRIDYEDSLGSYDSETEHAKGIHVGGGVEYRPAGNWSLNVDFRYIFIDEPGVDNSDLEKEKWDSWEITGGFIFRF